MAVLFCDVVGFTAYSEKNTPEMVFAELEMLTDRFEEIAAKHGLDKIKTVGDAFMATANLLSPFDEPVLAAVACALDMVAATQLVCPVGRCGSASITGRSRLALWARRSSSSTCGATR